MLMDDVTQQNAALVEEAAAAAQALTEQASSLTQLISRYSVGDAPAAVPAGSGSKPLPAAAAARALERRAPTRPMTGKKRPNTFVAKAPTASRALSPAAMPRIPSTHSRH